MTINSVKNYNNALKNSYIEVSFIFINRTYSRRVRDFDED